MIDAVALAAAERVERTLSAGAALATYRAIARRTSSADARTRALLGAFRCARRAGNVEAIAELAPLWESAGGGDHLGAIIDHCKNTRPDVAARLAAAEVVRHRTARALYLHARCLSKIDAAAAPALFAEAIERGQREGASEIVIAARLLRAELLAPGDRAAYRDLEEVRAADLARAAPALALALAGARLRSSSRFARASALATLEEVARGEDAARKLDAIRMAALHADERADSLTPLEADRIRPILRLWPDERAVADSLARLDALMRIAAAPRAMKAAALEAAARAAPELSPLLGRARALLAGAGGGPATGDDSASLGIAILAAERKGRASDALEGLSSAKREDLARAPASLWTAAYIALASRDALVRADAAALAGELLSHARTAPPRGFRVLALALLRAGHAALGVRALRAAAEAREPDSAEDLARELARAGWELARRGDSRAAARVLEEAKAVAAVFRR